MSLTCLGLSIHSHLQGPTLLPPWCTRSTGARRGMASQLDMLRASREATETRHEASAVFEVTMRNDPTSKTWRDF
ncbi:hypothetical protein NXT3_PB00153 (plasmid) [Sinorhizobium fredii]|uniref:Uncharacterized protein n=1 Tax=Rhizobium fredii TaxID=380 RepID=A0A2L0HBJ5_RHIFR|nr:hypothetical protein NXT3_PB00153 [Sinorhizobium fredii]